MWVQVPAVSRRQPDNVKSKLELLPMNCLNVYNDLVGWRLKG